MRFTLSPKMAHFDLEITPSGTTVRVVGDAAQEMHDAARGLQTATSELVLAAREQFPNFDEHLRDALARREEWAHAWRDALIRAMLHSAAPRVLCTAPAGAATVLDAYTLQADGLVLDLAGSGLRVERDWQHDIQLSRNQGWLSDGSGPLGLELTPDAIREFVAAAAEVAA